MRHGSQPTSSARTKVLAILEGARWPSAIVRALIYRDLFARDGFDVEFVSRLTSRGLGRVRPDALRLALIDAATRVNELRLLAKARSAELIYLCKVTSYRFIRMLRRHTRARIVLDFGDAMWIDDKGRRIEDEFKAMLQLVDAVTTDNELTATYVRRFGKECTVIPDSPQLEEFDRRRGATTAPPDGTVVVGWIGTAGTLYNIDVIAEALHVVSKAHPEMRLRLVGIGRDRTVLRALEGIPFTVRPSYDQSEMIDEVFGMDIGLFPLKDIEQSVVRGVLKATIYMAGEAAVIASPIGQVPDVITDSANGLLATSHDEWVTKLGALVGDATLRQRLAAAGLETVRNRFRTHQSWEMLRAVLRNEAA